MGDRFATIGMGRGLRTQAALPASVNPEPYFAAAVLLLWGGELGPHLTQCGLGEADLRTKWQLDPSNRLATMHQRYRQDRQTYNGRGRTVLQTVAQKEQKQIY